MARHLLKLEDIGSEGLIRVLDSADLYRENRGTPFAPRWLGGRSIGLLFEKASTRTRVSLEVAVFELGGNPLVIPIQGSQLGRGEPVADTARVCSRMVHAITFRTYSHARLIELAQNSSVPVLNTLTDDSHPMQLLADLQTARRTFGRLEGVKFAWIGDGNNMANSWIEAAGLLNLELVLACPEGYDPSSEELALARKRGASVQVVRDPFEAVRGANVVSTDVFASMGQEDEQEQRAKAFAGMKITSKLVNAAAPNAIVMHCLPAHRGEEIDAEVIDGPQSVVWDQAEARLHTAKAALEWALGTDG